MSTRDPSGEGARHSLEWYRERLGRDPTPPGGQVMLPCDGGPTRVRLEAFPPPIEIEVSGGVYVLVDDGPVHAWRYHFVSGRG